MENITYQDFEKVDIRVGRITAVEDFPQARKPAYKLSIDFGGEIGLKKSSVQLVANYSRDELMGKLVAGVVNFPPKQIDPFISEVLTLGFPNENGEAILASPTREIPLGGKLF